MTPARVFLLNTAAPDRPAGSMVRYAREVRAALASAAPDLDIQALDLAPPQAGASRLPSGLRTAARYWNIASHWRLLMPELRDGVAHWLDGSHAYALAAARIPDVPLVVTVHDLIPALALRGELESGGTGLVGGWIVRRALAGLARADVVIADSANTRRDAIRLARLDPAVVRVLHPPVELPDASAVPPAPADSGYILHVAGNNTFYKNRAGVVEIFRRIRAAEPVRLKLAGAPPDAALRRAIDASGVREFIDVLPDVTERELDALYRGAAFLLFPSLYEGFGWPPLEAMARGCPVVCSEAGSLPEIAGDAALTAPADEPEALAEHGLWLLHDPAMRRHLAVAGRKQARRFSRQAFGSGLLSAYRAAMEASRRRKENAGVPLP